MKHSLLLATLAISLAHQVTQTSLQPLRYAGQRALANASQRTLAGALQQKRMASALTTAHSPSLRKRDNGIFQHRMLSGYQSSNGQLIFRSFFIPAFLTFVIFSYLGHQQRERWREFERGKRLGREMEWQERKWEEWDKQK